MAKKKTKTPIKLIITRATKLSFNNSVSGITSASVVSLYMFLSGGTS